MKSGKPPLQKLSLTLVSCLILIGCNSGTNEPHRVAPFSQAIRKQKAEGLREFYLKHHAAILTTIDNTGDKVSLLKFTFKSGDILTLLSQINTNAGTPDKLVLKFGQDPLTGNAAQWHLIAYAMDGTGTFKPPIFYNSDYLSSSTSITTVVADASKARYKAQAQLTTVTDDTPPVSWLLDGFAFNADQIQEILSSNAFGKPDPDEVVFYLGSENVPGMPINRWRMIAYGRYWGNLLDVSYVNAPATTTLRAESVFDKATPCPPCTP